MKALWQLWEGALSPNECDAILNNAKSIPFQQGTIFRSNHIISDYRKSSIKWLHKKQGWSPLYGVLDEYFKEANENAFMFNLTSIETVQLAEYKGVDSGHYDWHEDVNWSDFNNLYHRKLTAVIQLSNPEDYEGGRLQLEYDDIPANKFKNKGDLLIFPSFLKHKVHPVTKGVRLSIASWYRGPKFR